MNRNLPPSRPGTSRLFALLASVLAAAVLGGYLLLQRPAPPSSPATRRPSHSAPPRGGSTATPSRDLDLAFSEDLLTLAAERRNAVLDELEAGFRVDPDGWADLIADVGLRLAQQSPEEAMRFLGRCSGQEVITQAERQIMLDWSRGGFAEFETSLRRQVSEHSAAPTRQMAFLAAIYQNERAGEIDPFLEWIGTFSAPEDRAVKVVAIDALTRLASDENLETIVRQFHSDPDLTPWLALLINRKAHQEPQAALALLETLPEGTQRNLAMEDLFLTLGRAHPDYAVELINDGAFERLGAAGATGQESDSLHDTALRRMLDGILASNPRYVLDCTRHFTDPALAAEYSRRADALIQAKE